MKRIMLQADEGKIYTDGIHYGLIVYLANEQNPTEYYQITLEEYYALLEQKEEQYI